MFKFLFVVGGKLCLRVIMKLLLKNIVLLLLVFFVVICVWKCFVWFFVLFNFEKLLLILCLLMNNLKWLVILGFLLLWCVSGEIFVGCVIKKVGWINWCFVIFLKMVFIIEFKF